MRPLEAGKMKWIPLGKAKRAEDPHDDGECRGRFYGRDGKAWPSLLLSVSGWHPDSNCFRLTCSTKEASGHWWENSEIPDCLAEDVVEMLKEYIKGEANGHS